MVKVMTVHLKEILGLGVSKVFVGKLGTATKYFKDKRTNKKLHGYAIEYDYQDVTLILIAWKVWWLGVTIRHIDLIIDKLQNKKLSGWFQLLPKPLASTKVRTSDFIVKDGLMIGGSCTKGYNCICIDTSDIKEKVDKLFGVKNDS
jgi:hypothetical protein